MTLTNNSVVDGSPFKIGEKIVVSDTKSFTVVDAMFRLDMDMKTMDVTLTVDYEVDGRKGTDKVALSRLHSWLDK